MDVRSACMMYLGVHLRHEANRCGLIGMFSKLLRLTIILGRVIKTSVAGDNQLTDAATNLKSSIDSYNAATGTISLRILVKVYEVLRGIVCFISSP